MLKIAMISYHTCPLASLGGKDTGGMNVYVKELTQHLGQLGVHVDVFTRSQDDHIPQVSHYLGYGNRVVHIPAGPEVPLSKKELSKHIPEFVKGINDFVKKKNLEYDLIHSHYWMSGIAAKELKSHWHVPVVQMFHTLGLMKNRIAQSENEIEGDYRINGEHAVINIADRIVVATVAELAQLEFLYKVDSPKMVVIPPGVDTAHFYPIPDDEAKDVIGVAPCDCMLLYVGRIEPLKGVDVLIRSVANLYQKGAIATCPTHLAIIGGEPDKEPKDMDAEMTRLQNLCEELGLKNVVLFLGKRSQDMLPYYYSAAEVVTVPSHYESFGMVALEAMACGTPVVASQVGGLAFLVEDGITGYVVPNGDHNALGDRLAKLINQPELREKMSENAVKHARNYDWNLISERIYQLYQDTLKNHRDKMVSTIQ